MEKVVLSKIKQDHIQQESLRKIISWSFLPLPPYLPDPISSYIRLFCSLQNALNNKRCSQENQGKMFEKSIFGLEASGILLERNQKVSLWMAKKDSK